MKLSNQIFALLGGRWRTLFLLRSIYYYANDKNDKYFETPGDEHLQYFKFKISDSIFFLFTVIFAITMFVH